MLGWQIARYGLVGLANTAIGYGLILAGLWIGLGDYRANALGYTAGLCFSFVANRRFTFDRRGGVTAGEIIRFLCCFAISYAANLAIIALGRAWGHAEHPFVHLAAMAVYSVLFFACMRSVTFRQKTV
jgi:putative flippase GtrA